MPKRIAVVAADCHLRYRTWSGRKNLTQDSYFALEQIADYCIEKHLPLILAGDIWDAQVAQNYDILRYRSVSPRLQDAGIPIHYIQGNHDRAVVLEDDIPAVPLPAAVSDGDVHIDHKLFKLGGRTFYGLDWQPASKLTDALLEIPESAEVLVCHQSWAELMKTGKAEGTLKIVPHVQLVITGDYHFHLEGTVTRTDGSELRYISPGSTCMQDIGEEPQKHFFVLYDDLSVKSIKLKGRPFERFRVETPEELDDLITNGLPLFLDAVSDGAAEHLPEKLVTPLVRVTYPNDLPDAFTRLTAAAEGRFHLFTDPYLRTVQGAEIDRQVVKTALAERGMLGVLAELPLDDCDDPDQTRTDVAAFLSTADPEALLEDYLKV